MPFYKWFEAGAIDPSLERAWSRERWTKMSKWKAWLAGTGNQKRPQVGRARSSALPSDRLADDYLNEELWEVELEGGERTGDGRAKKGRLLAPVEAWNDELQGELAKTWTFAARDHYVEALRIAGESGGTPGLGDSLAAAATRKEIEAAAAELSGHPQIPSELMVTAGLVDAARAVANEPALSAVNKALGARLEGIQAAVRVRSQLAEGNDYPTALRVSEEARGQERVRIGDELRKRLGLPLPDG